MTDKQQSCPHCRQVRGVQIVYGSIDTLSEALRSALENGAAVLGGAYPRWDWEEELINTRCLQCRHEWHGEHKNLRRAQSGLSSAGCAASGASFKTASPQPAMTTLSLGYAGKLSLSRTYPLAI